MSTRTSKIFIEKEGLILHLYNEMHDDLIHLELEDGKSNSSVNVVIPKHIAIELAKLLKPLTDEN